MRHRIVIEIELVITVREQERERYHCSRTITDSRGSVSTSKGTIETKGVTQGESQADHQAE